MSRLRTARIDDSKWFINLAHHGQIVTRRARPVIGLGRRMIAQESPYRTGFPRGAYRRMGRYNQNRVNITENTTPEG